MTQPKSSGPRVRAHLRSGPPSLLAGYWPAAVAVLALIVVAVAVPSRPQQSDDELASDDIIDTDDLFGDGSGLGTGPGSEAAGEGGAGDAGGGEFDPTAGPDDVAGPGGPTDDGPQDVSGDRSHCTEHGRQHDVTFHAPPCVPVFEGDNGGATYRGVTGDSIHVVGYFLECDPTTEALLTGLGFEITSCGQQEAMMRAAVAHLNDRLELYGREITYSVRWADCPYPEDLDTCLAGAREIIAQRPFAVVTNFSGVYQAVWEEFVRNDIVLVGGGGLNAGAYVAHSPYWWSWEMSASQQAALVGDWWCSTMAGRPADHTGSTIHPSIGKRGQVTRRAGLAYYDAPAGRAAAQQLTETLRDCGTELTTFAYTAELATLQQQSLAATSRFIADGVTSMLWFDYLAPTFVLPEFTRQGFFPENIGAGGSGAVADSTHRAVDPAQWRHYFGLYPESPGVPTEQTEAAAVLRDGGLRGKIPPHPDSYIRSIMLLGNLLQAAGPNLTPDALRAIESQERIGGDGSGDASGPREGLGFGPTDHNGVDDVREVYFDPNAISTMDGGKGALVNSDGGARRGLGGDWAGPDAVPVAGS